MKIQCLRETLVEGMGLVSRAVSGRGTMPILDCVLLVAAEEGLRMVANDLELGIETKGMGAQVMEAGEIALEARTFSDIVRRLPGEDVYIESMGNFVTVIRSGGAEFKILGSPGDEFPLLPELGDSGVGFEIFSGKLKDMIRQTIFSVSTDESKPAMTGVLFEVKDGRLMAASVDGHRVSVRYGAVDNKELESSVIVPGKTLGEVMKILDSGDKSIASICFTDKHILFETDEVRIVSRLIEGKFMDIDGVFTTEGTTFMTIGGKELLECIERSVLISREAKKSPVKFSIEQEAGRLVVESNTEMGTFREELSVVIDGLDLSISFNPRFIMDVLKVIDEESVQLMYTTPLSPCIIKGVDSEDHKYLVLPLRVAN